MLGSTHDIVLTIVPPPAKSLRVTAKEIQEVMAFLKKAKRRKYCHLYGFQLGALLTACFLLGTALTLFIVSENKKITDETTNNFDGFKASALIISLCVIEMMFLAVIKAEQIRKHYEFPFNIAEKNAIDDLCKRLKLHAVNHQTQIRDLLTNLNNELEKVLSLEKKEQADAERRRMFLLGSIDENSHLYKFFSQDKLSHEMTKKIFEYAGVMPQETDQSLSR